MFSSDNVTSINNNLKYQKNQQKTLQKEIKNAKKLFLYSN